MGDAEVIGATLAENGFEAASYFAGVQEQGIKDELKRRVEQAVAKGVFGAPTFFVGGEMFWGQDRLDHVERALQDGATG